ncbi:hypothetical protein N9895_02130 [Gammaproteobacteria bacterium]|nr:hypothetical protein [Gammaproteobacteria bacterium]
MALTYYDLLGRMKLIDEITLIEILEVTSEELVDLFSDRINDRFNELVEDFEDEH